MSFVTGYGFCAWLARPAGQGRSGVSAPQMCTCESAMSIRWLPSVTAPRGSAMLVAGARVVELLVVLAQQVPAIVIAVRRAHHRVDMGA